MKKILFLLTTLFLFFVSCSDDEKSKNSLNPFDTAIIKADSKTKSIIFDDLTSYQDSVNAIFNVEGYLLSSTEYGVPGQTGLLKDEVDRNKKEFTLKNRWVIDQNIENGPYVLGRLVNSTELIIMRSYTDGQGFLYDTIAYVPSKILIDTGNKIKTEFAKENYDECRRLYQQSYVFKPIDAAGYEKLKAAGLN